jgi:hypothetical protein
MFDHPKRTKQKVLLRLLVPANQGLRDDLAASERMLVAEPRSGYLATRVPRDAVKVSVREIGKASNCQP